MDFHVQKTKIYTFLDRDIDLMATFYEESGRIEFNCITRDYYWHDELHNLGRFINRICEFVKEKQKEIEKEKRYVKRKITSESERESRAESKRQEALSNEALDRRRRHLEEHPVPEENGTVRGDETVSPGESEGA